MECGTHQEDGSLGHKVYRKPTHTDRYLHYNSFHHPSIKSSVCKTLINRAKTICEVDNIEGELELLRSVLKMNGYPKKFIDNAMKTRQHVREKIEYQSSVSLPYIAASHKIERILKEAGIQLYYFSENKLFRSLCTHKDSNEFQKPGVYRICQIVDNFDQQTCSHKKSTHHSHASSFKDESKILEDLHNEIETLGPL